MAENTGNACLFRSIGNGRLVDQVVEEIQKLIIAGQLEPGMKLPPERDLAEILHVSRTIVREAVHILVTKGLLVSRQGVGTVVLKVSNNQISEQLNLLLQLNHVSLDNIHQVRSILEVEIVGLAAGQATREDIRQLRKILDEMAGFTRDTQAFADKDGEFHTTLAMITRNPLFNVLLDSIRDLLQEIRLSVSESQELFATVLPDHREILESVARKDVEGARQAMQAHLQHARTIQEKAIVKKPAGGSKANQGLPLVRQETG